MHDDDAGQPAGGAGGAGEKAAHLAAAVGRGIFEVFGEHAVVLLGHLGGEGVLRAQHLEQGGGGQAADGELGGPVDEAAAVDLAVDVVVVEVEQFLVEILRGAAGHGVSVG